MTVSGDEQRAALLAAKLRALTREHRPGTTPLVDTFPAAAGLRVEGQGWFHAEDDPIRSLGPALAWSRRHGLDELHVVADDAAVAAVLERRARELQAPPRVWSVRGDALVHAEPADFPPPPDPPDGVETLLAVLEVAGVEVVVEHGEYAGEVNGLEVARVVVGPEGPQLEVGVGRHDREAFALLHGDVPTADALASVVRTVREHRRPGATSHPLNRLAASRWLRALAMDDPGAFGFRELRPRSLTHVRGGVKERHPAAAVGTDRGGARVVAVFSVGVDLDLVPTAADARRHEEVHGGPVDRLVLVLPRRDAVPPTVAQAERLGVPAVLHTVDDDWWA